MKLNFTVGYFDNRSPQAANLVLGELFLGRSGKRELVGIHLAGLLNALAGKRHWQLDPLVFAGLFAARGANRVLDREVNRVAQ
jgi:hypothetical protein